MTNIVKASGQITPYEPTDIDGAWRIAKAAAVAKCFSAKTAEEAFMVLAVGNQYGLSAPQALMRLSIIKGRIAPSADTLVGVLLSLDVCEYFEEIETTEEKSTWATKRKGRPERRSTFTMAEAKRAGLVRPDSSWTSFPKRMLSARAKAFLARDVYPDVFAGMYTEEESDGIQRDPVQYQPTVTMAEPVEVKAEPAEQNEQVVIEAKASPDKNTLWECRQLPPLDSLQTMEAVDEQLKARIDMGELTRAEALELRKERRACLAKGGAQ